MSNSKAITSDLLKIKIKVMIERINRLSSIYKMLFKNTECESINSLSIIKEQYVRMCSLIVENGEYEKYKEVENVIINQLAKIEWDLDKEIYNTIPKCKEIIANFIKQIEESDNYQNFVNLDEKLIDIKTLKELLKLYSPYISRNEIAKIQQNITLLKFELLFRKQVEQLIYENGAEKSNLTQYDNEQERKCFINQLQEKIKKLTDIEQRYIVDDKEVKVEADKVLSNKQFLQRLIIIDMERNPDYYINSIKAKVFNPHLCNIANNPFKKEVYLTEEQLHELGYWEYGRWNRRGEEASLKANKVNYSLLRALLESIITDENISIIECKKLYKRFGFKCKPILTNIGQKCVKMIYDKVKGTEECTKILEEQESAEKSKQGNYCIIDFEGLIYNFDGNEYPEKVFSNEILSEIKVEKVQKNSKTTYSKQQETYHALQTKKEKIKREGGITKDIDIIILLMEDMINSNETEKNKLEQKKIMSDKNRRDDYCDIDDFGLGDIRHSVKIDNYERKIKRLRNSIEELENIKSKNGKLTLEETKRMLELIDSAYRESGINYNVWDLLPLECMGSSNSGKIYLAPIPEESGTEKVTVSHSFSYGFKYKDVPYYKSTVRPLWRKYQSEFKALGINVKKCSKHYEGKPKFQICVNLDDISDLPIDYEKVKLISKDELEKIIEREEGKEK